MQIKTMRKLQSLIFVLFLYTHVSSTTQSPVNKLLWHKLRLDCYQFEQALNISLVRVSYFSNVLSVQYVDMYSMKRSNAESILLA